MIHFLSKYYFWIDSIYLCFAVAKWVKQSLLVINLWIIIKLNCSIPIEVEIIDKIKDRCVLYAHLSNEHIEQALKYVYTFTVRMWNHPLCH